MYQQTSIEEYFNKSFEFTGNEDWTLPEEAYCTPQWSIEALQLMKVSLNTVKGQLSKFPISFWSNHTKRTDPSSLIKYSIRTRAKIELLTQAWCKFYECLNTYRLIPESCTNNESLHSLHLCEAPGAFITALNHYLFVNHRNMKWRWNANTLNPYYEGNNLSEMIIDDSLIANTIDNWEFGKDQTGDIRKFYNYEDLIGKFTVDLITADGSVDCMNDPGEQEHNVHHLHYCEVMIALRVLCVGGNFVLKLFTMYEHGTISLMYLLNCCFKSVQVFKPCSSKSGNSEVYVMCFCYRGFDVLSNLWDSLISSYKTVKKEAMFDLSKINVTFLQQLEDCAQYFMELQCDQINRNIELFTEEVSSEVWDSIKDIQEKVANAYLNKCPVSNVPTYCRLLKNTRKKPRIIHRELDVKVTSNYKELGVDNLIKIRGGLVIDVVRSSWFGCVSTKVSRKDYPIPEFVSPMNVISGSSFDSEISQGDLHRDFLHMVLERSRRCCNVMICGVPLLTRFLVGVVYVLSLGFDSFVVCKSGIVFHNYNEFKFYIVKKHLETIAAAFEYLRTKDFVEDILEVVPMKVLRKSNFYKAVYKYNTEICT